MVAALAVEINLRNQSIVYEWDIPAVYQRWQQWFVIVLFVRQVHFIIRAENKFGNALFREQFPAEPLVPL